MSKFFNNSNNNDIDFSGHDVDFGGATLDFTGANIIGTADFSGATVDGIYGFTPYDQPPTSPTAYDDEFTGSGLDGKWTLVNGTTFVGRVYNTWGKFATPNGAPNYKGIYQTLPSGNGDYIMKVCYDRVMHTGDGWIGIGLINNVGTGTILLYGNSGAGQPIVQDTNLTTYNYSTTLGTANTVGFVPYVWLRLIWDSSAVRYTPYYSFNGFTWIQKQATNFINPGTPTRIFIGHVITGTVTPINWYIDYFRKIA